MKRLLLSFLLVGLCLLAAPPPAHAYKFFEKTCGGAAASSTVCNDNGSGNNPLTGCDSKGDNQGCGDGLLMQITNIVAWVAGAAAVVLLIVGAIRYVTSGSDTSVGSRIDDDVLNAKRTIINALVGLAIVILARQY